VPPTTEGICPREWTPAGTGEKRRAQRSQRNTRVICTSVEDYLSANEGNDSDTPRRECDDRLLSGENARASRAWPELGTSVVARIF
jgi:hypothetical protein